MWESIAFFILLMISGAIRNRFCPAPPDTGATRWLKPLAVLVGAAIALVVIWFSSLVFHPISAPLVFATLAGTAVVLALRFYFGSRSQWWLGTLFELAFFAIAIVIFLCIPAAGIEGPGLFTSFALSMLCLIELAGCLFEKRTPEVGQKISTPS
jgi:hypothetical protein